MSFNCVFFCAKGNIVQELVTFASWEYGWIMTQHTLWEKLEKVDTSSVSPMTTVTPMDSKERSDKISDGNYPDEILRNAPSVKEGFFSVPKVIEWMKI